MGPGLDKYLGPEGKRGGEEGLTLVPRDVLAELMERLTRLEERVADLERRLGDLERRQGGGSRGRGEGSPQRKGSSAFQRALEAMNEKGFVSIAVDLAKLPQEERDRAVKRLEQMGGVKLELEGDTIIVHPSVYREFKSKLETVGERDPVASVELFGRAGRLFNELYRRGLVFYDARAGRWRML